MKKIFFIITLAITNFAFAQVIIGKETITNKSVLIEFDNSNTNTKGLILPSVDALKEFKNINSETSSPNNGTLVFNKTTRQFHMYENNKWVIIGEKPGSTAKIIESPNAKEVGQGVIIGSDTSEAEGILILESKDKALVLPQIADPHVNVKQAYAGMICYDTSSNSVAFFDGINWNYYQ